MAYIGRALATIAAMTAITAALACSSTYSVAEQQPIELPIEQPQPTPHVFRITGQREWSGVIVREMTLTLMHRKTGKMSSRDAYLVIGYDGIYAITNIEPDASCPLGIGADARKAQDGKLEFTVEGHSAGPVRAINDVSMLVVEADSCLKFLAPGEPTQPPAEPLPLRPGDYA